MKFKTKRFLSRLLAFVTIATSVIQSVPALAVEGGAEKPPSYEMVKEFLDADEVVTAKDLEIEVGSSFDIEKDFTNIEIPDSKKVEVTFEEAKNDQNEPFANDHKDTYKVIYYVEPQTTDHPTYQINCKIIVKDTAVNLATESDKSQTEGQSDSGGGGEESAEDGEADSENLTVSTEEITEETEVVTEEMKSETVEQETESESEVLSEEEFDEAIEESEEQDIVDKESGLSLSEVLLQAGEQGIAITDMEEGETVTFETVAETPMLFSTRASQSVSITRGSWYYYGILSLSSFVLLNAFWFVSTADFESLIRNIYFMGLSVILLFTTTQLKRGDQL